MGMKIVLLSELLAHDSARSKCLCQQAAVAEPYDLHPTKYVPQIGNLRPQDVDEIVQEVSLNLMRKRAGASIIQIHAMNLQGTEIPLEHNRIFDRGGLSTICEYRAIYESCF